MVEFDAVLVYEIISSRYSVGSEDRGSSCIASTVLAAAGPRLGILLGTPTTQHIRGLQCISLRELPIR